MRLDLALRRTWRPPVQTRYGTVTSVSPGICQVQVAGGEIPVIYMKGAAPNVGDFVMVRRQGVVSYTFGVPSGALWATGNAGYVWRITTEGAVTQFGPFLSAQGDVGNDIVEGPDGNLWIAGEGTATGTLLRVTPAGSASLYSLAGANPTSICVGPDKNLWVGDANGGVWRTTTAGLGTRYQFTTSACGAVCVGPDSNIWVADSVGNIWKVPPLAPSQAVAYLVSTTASISGMCSGPDGRLWLSDLNGILWAVATAGAVTEFPLIAPQSLNDVCSGPDGRLWAVSYSSGAVVACTTSGSATVYSLTPLDHFSAPQGICVGPDKNLWVADTDNEIWKLTTAGVISGPYPKLEGLPNSPYAICSGP